MKLSDFIKARRMVLGMSMRDLAKKARMSTTYLHHLEAGDNTNPTCKVILKLAIALQISSVNLFRIAIHNELDNADNYL